MNSSALQQVSQRPAAGLLQSNVGERFLGLIFPADVHALLSLGSLQGVVEIQPQEILPVPHMPAHLLGIINWRGKSTWVADLTYLVGGSYLTPTPESKVLMVQSGTNTIGLLVDRTLSVINYDATLALPVDEGIFPAPMRSMLSGYFLDDQHQMWVLIDLPQIFQMMNL